MTKALKIVPSVLFHEEDITYAFSADVSITRNSHASPRIEHFKSRTQIGKTGGSLVNKRETDVKDKKS